MKALTLGVALGAASACAGLAQTQMPVNCTVSPAQTIELSAPVAGVVAEVSVARGQHVSAGDVILRLDDDLARGEAAIAREQAAFVGAITAAQAQVASLSARRDRLQNALNQRAIPQADFDALVLELELAEITLERELSNQQLLLLQAAQAELLVEKLVITSPIDAVIGEDLIAPGEATTGRPLATLYSVGPARVEAFVPVPLLDEVLEAESVSVTQPGTDLSFAVTLDYVAPVANLSSNTIAAYFTLDEDGMRPGSTCRLVY